MSFMMSFTIHGRIPSKKNMFKFTCAGRVPRKYLTPKYNEWHTSVLYQLKDMGLPSLKIDETYCVIMTFYAPDNRKFDLTNKAESIQDLLVDYGYFEDDNYKVIPDLSLRFGGVDKENPRVEIEVF